MKFAVARWRLILAFAVLLPVVQGCLVATKNTIISPEITSLFKGQYKIDPYMEDHRPRTVAVLPFVDQSGSKEGFEPVRRGFYNHFSSLPFKDLELYRTDDLLRKADLTDPEAISKKTPQELGKILGVDAVVYGDISNFDKLFAVVYSQVAVGADIRMYDTATGKFLWSGRHTVRIHEGGISTTPVGLIATIIATSMNVRDIQLLRACDDLFRDMVKTIPTPSLAEQLRPPVITLLTQDTKGLPKKAGDEIRVVIQGDPKKQASFSIGGFKKDIEMREIEPGGYLGTYRVIPGDNVSKALITGYLRDDSGGTAEWVDALGTVTIDTTPPAKIGKVAAVGRNTTVLLNWEKSATGDLAGYRVYRSETPLTGYAEIAKTELPEFRDAGLVNSKKYYYAVTAVDRAGNESDRSDALAGMPVAPGPTPVGGVIETDTTWVAGASPYVIEETILVRDKATLTIEPGTEIRSRGGALVIEGRLLAEGDAERLIAFDAMEPGKSWGGIAFNNVKERENILRYCRIRSAGTAVSCQASSPRVEFCELTGNGTAIKIAGAFSKPVIGKNALRKNSEAAVIVTDGARPSIDENRIEDNEKEGLLIVSAMPTVTRNVITQNRGTGIVIQKSKPIIAENNITDNKPLDAAADMTGEAVSALDNWWGTAKGIEVLARVRGKVDIRSVLTGPYPEGKPLELPILGSPLAGTVKTDSFLTLSNSPYRVAKDVVLDGGATLYVEPGVVLQYDHGTSIIAEDGGIIARGTPDRPILFTSSAVSPSPGAYAAAVQFKKATKVNSALAFCIVKYASTAFDMFHGSPEISSCAILYSAQNGIFCRNDSAPKIALSTFKGNQGEGAIKCVGMSNPTIRNNNFVENAVSIQTFSSIYIDARQNWWGRNPPDLDGIWGDLDKNINIKPWLEAPAEKAFSEE
ncbi:MAG TPA: DUF799 family lipoprotein [Syntrophales bacterium]|nr:DUF799 family lipoprotein [Syntrophales bacterium]